MCRSIDQLRSQSKEGVVATLHFPAPIIYVSYMSEATAGMTTSALFCYSIAGVRYPRPCIGLLLLDSTHSMSDLDFLLHVFIL